MLSLDKDLQAQKQNIKQFGEITLRVLNYLPNVLSKAEHKNNYTIYSSEIAGTKKFLRPINNNLFIKKPDDFENSFEQLKNIFNKIKNNRFIIEFNIIKSYVICTKITIFILNIYFN